MSPHHPTGRLPFTNPIANALVAIVGVLAVAASLVLGFVAFITLGTLVLVLASIIGIRVWWFGRKLKRGMAAEGATSERRQAQDVIEGEYRIVSERDPRGSTRES